MKNLDLGFTEILIARNILEKLQSLGMEKVNFVGGEPMLNPLINDIIRMAKEMGFIVSITTNGSLLNEKSIKCMAPYADWIGISIDSINESIEKELGRGFGNHIKHAVAISDIIHEHGIHLKINSTVTKLSYMEDMKPLIARLNPDRWKSFQVLHIKGQNDEYFPRLSITENEFEKFILKNKNIVLKGGAQPIFERCDDMIDSYFMISPSGNIILNTDGMYKEYPLENIEKGEIENILNAERYMDRYK
jgi:radical S-adenosyl methionine domain-containing protein 2